jgi:heme o synthase
LLFGILFLWQFPHFLAIALMYREDYARAGYQMLPDFDRDTRFTRMEIVGFTLILVLATMLPLGGRAGVLYWVGTCVAGAFLRVGTCVAGAFLLYHVGKLAASSSTVRASRLLHATVLYLPVVLVIMVASKK